MNARARAGRLVVSLSLLLLSACVSTSFRPAQGFHAGALPATSPATVRVLVSPPNQAFMNLGEVEAYVSGFPSDQAIIRKARERAASIGAHAIILEDGLTMMPGGNDEFLHKKLASVRFRAVRLLSEGSSQPYP